MSHNFETKTLSIMHESLCFDDVLLRPRQSSVKSRSDINISTKLATDDSRQIHLKKPLISSPMDTVTDSEMAIHMALNGGLGIVHRFMSLDNQVAEIARVKRYVNYIFYQPYTIHSSATVLDAINEVRNNNVTTLCVVDTLNKDVLMPKLLGLITRRDLQPYVDQLDNMHSATSLDTTLHLDTLVSNVMTKIADLHIIKFAGNLKNNIEHNATCLDEIMMAAYNIMSTHGIEKVPVINAYYHDDYEYGNITPSTNTSIMGHYLESTGELIGMITRRSVDFYMYRRHLACLDKQGRLCVGAAVGIKDDMEDHASQLVNAGADLLCVDVANGHNIHTVNAVRILRQRFPNTVIMAGNIVTAEGYRHLADAGADCIRVGIGNGSICTTRLETGVGYGQFSAMQEIYNASLSIADLKHRPIIISDGGSLGKTGNKMKALAAGANAVMLGRSLASCEESPGSIIVKNGKRMKYYRGMASTMASLSNQEQRHQQTNCDAQCGPITKRSKRQTVKASEGVSGMVEIQCSVGEKLEAIAAGIKSGMSYLGAFSMEELDSYRRDRKIEWGRCTAIGMSETGTRVQKI